MRPDCPACHTTLLPSYPRSRDSRTRSGLCAACSRHPDLRAYMGVIHRPPEGALDLTLPCSQAAVDHISRQALSLYARLRLRRGSLTPWECRLFCARWHGRPCPLCRGVQMDLRPGGNARPAATGGIPHVLCLRCARLVRWWHGTGPRL